MTTKKKRGTFIVLLLFVVGAASVVARFHGQAQKTRDTQLKEEATVIQEGQMTEKQRQHSKLFKHPGRKLRDLAATRGSDVEVEVDAGDSIVLPTPPRKTPVFQSALCNADAVVIGTITNKSSQLTEQGNFVFTDHDITVEEVIKNNAAAAIQQGSTITATRDGGVVEIDNRILRAKREDFEAPLVGKRYLLFLRFIPTTGSYLMYGNGTFQLEGDKVLALGPAARQELVNGGSKDVDDFLTGLRSFASSDCGSA